jgi:hypothetical protein
MHHKWHQRLIKVTLMPATILVPTDSWSCVGGARTIIFAGKRLDFTQISVILRGRQRAIVADLLLKKMIVSRAVIGIGENLRRNRYCLQAGYSRTKAQKSTWIIYFRSTLTAFLLWSHTGPLPTSLSCVWSSLSQFSAKIKVDSVLETGECDASI